MAHQLETERQERDAALADATALRERVRVLENALITGIQNFSNLFDGGWMIDYNTHGAQTIDFMSAALTRRAEDENRSRA
jgi:hypothetical protein